MKGLKNILIKSSLLLSILTGAFLFSSETLSFIPADSMAVISVNQKSLFEKADMESVFSADYLDRVRLAASEFGITNIFSNSAILGLDLESQAYMYLKYYENISVDSEPDEIGMIMPLSDGKKLTAFLEKNIENDKSYHKAELYNYLEMEEGMLAWTDDKLIIFAGAVDDVQGLFDTLLTNNTNSIMGNDSFASLNADAPDIGFWLNTKLLKDSILENKSETLSNSTAPDKDRLIEFFEATEVSEYSARINFHKGKLTLDLDKIVHDEVLLKYAGKLLRPVDPKVYKYMPASNLAFFTAFGIDMPLLREMISSPRFNPLFEPMNKITSNTFVRASGPLNAETLLEIMEGDVAVALGNGFLRGSDDIYLAFTINKGEAYDTYTNYLLSASNTLYTNGYALLSDGTVFIEKDSTVYLTRTNGIDNILNETATEGDFKRFLPLLEKHNMLSFIDINPLMPLLLMNKPSARESASALVALCDDIYIHPIHKNGEKHGSRVTFSFLNKEENSLNLVIKYIEARNAQNDGDKFSGESFFQSRETNINGKPAADAYKIK